MRWGIRKSQSALMVLTLQSPLGPRRAHDKLALHVIFREANPQRIRTSYRSPSAVWVFRWFQAMMSAQQALGAQGKKDKSPRVRDISCIIRLTLGNRRAALPQNCP